MSSSFADDAVLNAFGKIERVDQISIQFVMKHREKAQSFSFARIWFLLRTIPSLSVQSLAL